MPAARGNTVYDRAVRLRRGLPTGPTMTAVRLCWRRHRHRACNKGQVWTPCRTGPTGLHGRSAKTSAHMYGPRMAVHAGPGMITQPYGRGATYGKKEARPPARVIRQATATTIHAAPTAVLAEVCAAAARVLAGGGRPHVRLGGAPAKRPRRTARGNTVYGRGANGRPRPRRGLPGRTGRGAAAPTGRQYVLGGGHLAAPAPAVQPSARVVCATARGNTVYDRALAAAISMGAARGGRGRADRLTVG